MLLGWIVLACISALVAVVPMHLSLWLPLTDRRLKGASDPGRMSRRALWLVFGATVGLHLIWTLLTSLAFTPAVGSLLQLTLANLLLAPFLFTTSFAVWLHWRILREPDRQASPGGHSDQLQADLPSVTVVIACRNEPVDVVLMTLRSAQQMSYPRSKLDILIADNSDEDHPDYLALCREVEARQGRGESVGMLHRNSTRGFKAGNLDMALQASRGDLILFLDVDNSVPGDLLLAHAAPLWRDPDCSYLQFFKFVCNGHQSLVAAAAATSLGYSVYWDLALAAYGDWSFFQGHACLWKCRDLLKIVPLSQSFRGDGILTEDLYMSFRASRLGLFGRTQWIPSAYWAPIRLEDFEKMIGRWSQGTLQSYFKDWRHILFRAMGYDRFDRYACLWYRVWQYHIMWLLPLVALLLPFSHSGAWMITGVWVLTCLLLPLLVMGLKGDADICGKRSSPIDLLRLHLLESFRAWSNFRGLILFLFAMRPAWALTPKASAECARHSSLLGVLPRFRGALGFSLLASGLALGSRSLMSQSPLSPAALPILYFSCSVLLAVFVFAPSRPAPAGYVKRQRDWPAWMGRGGSLAASVAE